MTVYVVVDFDYVFGVYSTKEVAEEAIRTCNLSSFAYVDEREVKDSIEKR